MSEHDEVMDSLKIVAQQVAALRKELSDSAITFAGHPTMKLQLMPGDTLVVKIRDRVISDEEAKYIKKLAASCVPEGVKIMVLDRGTDVMKLEVRS